MVGNKREKKEKRKEKSVGTWVEEKKSGEKEKKEGKESPRVCVWREKKKERKKLYHNIFTINLKVGYY